MSEHTPGPWEACLQYGGLDYEVYSADPWKLADVLESADGEFSGEANARLISAAPELLEATRGLLNALVKAPEGFGYAWPMPRQDELSGAWIAAQEAIGKAEGKE